jgi:hypothetical protein
MKLEGVTLRANCHNCRHYNRDERAAYRQMRTLSPTRPPVFCPEKGFREGICNKFVPRKADVQHAIWLAREKLKQ